MKEFSFPSLSLLKKSTEGQLDVVKCLKSLKITRGDFRRYSIDV